MNTHQFNDHFRSELGLTSSPMSLWVISVKILCICMNILMSGMTHLTSCFLHPSF